MAAAGHARQLLEEFSPFVRHYNLGAALLGVGFGAWDRPVPRKKVEVLPVPTSVHSGLESDAEAAPSGVAAPAQRPSITEIARKAAHDQPKELGFLRQLVLTTPGVVLAFRLGRRAREINAAPSALLLAAVPSLSCPLLLYILGGYPTGAILRSWWEGQLE
eukprot:TRINITY_DN126358_c0_g1_i1.p1 TRINITY_DN126358_c0_g1~~TRINITY_DN126358_c0_g1_i1.p1  ORF type:complete len:161 (-),score=19.64 TRINITY_DN126358_c0_g1_i1:196-678(-)